MSWNIQGTGDPGTARAVADMVERLDPDVFCAVEVWHRTSKVLDSLLRNHCGYILAGAAGEIVCCSKLQMGEVVPVENSGDGFGYGSTIHHPLSFRIDHILYSDRLRLRSVGRVKACGLSDHDALVASFDLNQPDGEEP
ncbi:MAG: hypothetical protein MJY84_07960 [Bacteroidales bacterium]|nr:hypothetical protein [Bacteroidales bacterium]